MGFLIFLVSILVVMLALGGLSEYSRRKSGDRPSHDVSQRIEHKIDTEARYSGKKKQKKDDDDPMSQFDHLFEEQEDLWAKYDKKR